MTELLKEMLQSEVFWKALGAIVAAIWSLPAVQWFRRELREQRLGFLLDAARDVATQVYRESRDDLVNGDKSPDEVRRSALLQLQDQLAERAPRLLGRVTEQQLDRLIDQAMDEKEVREGQKPKPLRARGPED